jgi:trans-AT polyketide synthase, acyltransferase and oxidoreductase domains
MKAIIFPGQGSQRKGMGAELFDRFADMVNQANSVLGYSLPDLCLRDQENRLNHTQYSQPALFAVNAMTYLAATQNGHPKPEYLAGHSLGEYSALWASGAFDFETGLRLVRKRGELMGRIQNGGMLAVVGLKQAVILDVLKQHSLDGIDVANYNTSTQIVLSGSRQQLEIAKPIFENGGAQLVVMLPVSGAFHSRFMGEVQEELTEYLKDFRFADLKIPVLANVDSQFYSRETLIQRLRDQLTHPVQWTDTIRRLMGLGLRRPDDFKEAGPGGVLTGLVRKILTECEPLAPPERTPKISATNARPGSTFRITAESLGSQSFKEDYGLKYAYVAGAMVKGIASKEMVVRMGRSGLLAYFGTGGMRIEQVRESIAYIQSNLKPGQPYGMNLLCNLVIPREEQELVELYLRSGVQFVEAAAFMQITSSLVRYRLTGAHRDSKGDVVIPNHILAKVSRPEVARAFMQPAPPEIVDQLLKAGHITRDEADLARHIPMAHDICMESDSGGHTDQRVALTALPAMMKLRQEVMAEFRYKKPIRVGAAGGIGTPEAAAAVFIMGADFVVTGSINQSTVEAGTSDAAKDILESMNFQDTAYAPAGDMFEIGARVQVVRKGLFFPARANKLYELYRQYNSLDEIGDDMKQQIQERYCQRSFAEIWDETRDYYLKRLPEEIERAERNPKHRMALIFRWYFVHSMRMAQKGVESQKVNFQIHCGPAMGSFNQWVRGTPLESWRHRHVDEIAVKLMSETAEHLTERYRGMAEYGTTSI